MLSPQLLSQIRFFALHMFFCYIIYSATLSKYYVGSTSDIDGRLRRHLSDHKGFTGKSSDWELKFKEPFNSKEEALRREKQIKSWKSKKMIEKLISED